jgi:hypothetical protein
MPFALRCSGIIALGAGSLFAATPAHAQSTTDTPAAARPESFDPSALIDSLGSITERRTIRRIEAQNAESGTAAGAISAGFAALRSWELSHLKEDARQARRHFERARELAPQNAWPLYGWAVALMPEARDADDPGRFGFAGDDGLLQDLGLDARSRARRALEKAIAIDPGHVGAARLLARLAVETHDSSAVAQAKTALRDIARAMPHDAESQIALADAALADDDFETAAAAALDAVASATGSQLSRAHHLAARALLRIDGREAQGASEYFAGLQALDRTEAERYYDELRGIATPGEMAQLERLPFVRAQLWIHTFWEMHAALSAVTVPHRLATHFQRLPHAEEFYRREQRFGAPSRNALLLERPQSPFDDRGVIYLRHGPPDDVINTRNTESWVYNDLGTAPVLYHFTDGATEGITGFNDWYLMYNLPCDPDFLAARSSYDRRLAKLLHHCDPLTLREVSALVRSDVRDGLASDLDPHHFEHELRATYDIFSFRGDHGWTDLVATIGIQAAELKARPGSGGGTDYAASTSVIVVDTATRDVFRKDTVIAGHAAAIADRGSILIGAVTLSALPAPGAVHRLAITDEVDDARGQVYGGPLKVPDYAGDTLMISDIVLAKANTGGSFNRGDVSLSLVPWQAFERGEFRIFYEIYNASPGERYTTELLLERAGGGVGGAISKLFGNRTAVKLRFDDVAPQQGRVIQQVRDAQADPNPGDYRLTVTITDQRTGQKVTRVRPVTVIRASQ